MYIGTVYSFLLEAGKVRLFVPETYDSYLLGGKSEYRLLKAFGYHMGIFPYVDLVLDDVEDYFEGLFPDHAIRADSLYVNGELVVTLDGVITRAVVSFIVPLKGYRLYKVNFVADGRHRAVWVLFRYPDWRFSGAYARTEGVKAVQKSEILSLMLVKEYQAFFQLNGGKQ